MKIPLLSFALAVTLNSFAQNDLPQVTRVEAVKTALGFTINYDLADAENEACQVYLRASTDGGKTFNLRPALTSGDIGVGITPGTGKSITWTLSLVELAGLANEYIFRVVADDGYRPTIDELVAQIDSNRIKENFLQVYGNNSPRDSVHYKQSRERIRDHYTNLGLQTELDTFFSDIPDTLGLTRMGINVLATIQGLGNPDTTVLMTGHYDTVDDTPGADDNNMSVAVCMEAARVLKDYSFNYNLRFANWDLEEIGLLGAYYYALSSKSLGTKAVYNFDGISLFSEEPNSQKIPTGFDILFPAAYQKAEADSFRGNFITLISDVKSRSLGAKAVEFAPLYTPNLKFIDVSCPDPNCLVATDLRRSDHAPFWDRGIPALFFTSSTEFRSDCYHQPCDTSINLNFSTQVIQLASALMANSGGIMHAGKGFSAPLVTSVKSIDDKTGIKIGTPYPNPVSHACFFELQLSKAETIKLLVRDVQGKLIDEHMYVLNAGKQTLAWTPDRDLPQGLYTAELKFTNGTSHVYKLQIAIDAAAMHQHH